jgi:hypothetical protein
MFLSGYRVSEPVGGHNMSNASDEAFEDSESLSVHEDNSSSDMLNQIDDINEFMFKQRERKASLTV